MMQSKFSLFESGDEEIETKNYKTDHPQLIIQFEHLQICGADIWLMLGKLTRWTLTHQQLVVSITEKRKNLMR
jgi:hypothetical protein